MDLLTLPRAYYLPDPVPTCDIQTVWKRGEWGAWRGGWARGRGIRGSTRCIAAADRHKIERSMLPP
jgi:hypothetical protein